MRTVIATVIAIALSLLIQWVFKFGTTGVVVTTIITTIVALSIKGRWYS